MLHFLFYDLYPFIHVNSSFLQRFDLVLLFLYCFYQGYDKILVAQSI